MIAIQFIFGHPRFLCLSFGCQFRVCFASRFSAMWCTCPSRCKGFCFRMFSSSVIPVLCRACSFVSVTLSFQLIPNNFLGHLCCAASNFLKLATVMGKLSATYCNVETIWHSYSRICILLFNDLLFQMLFSLPKFVFAFHNLVDISMSQVPSSVGMLPR